MGTTADKLNKLLETKQAIKTAIIDKGVEVSDTDTFRNYATKISEISSGSSTKYGVSLDSLLGDVDENGVLQYPNKEDVFVGRGIKEIQTTLRYKFYHSGIKSVSFPDLTKIYSSDTCAYMFNSCDKLETVDLSSLTEISGSNACTRMFERCTNLVSADLSSLTKISKGNACNSMFLLCTKLETVDLSNLTEISGGSECISMFANCYNLTTISFPKLQSTTNNSFNGMFSSCNKLKEIHFRTEMQETIESMNGYSSKFGASNATIYFDL